MCMCMCMCVCMHVHVCYVCVCLCVFVYMPLASLVATHCCSTGLKYFEHLSVPVTRQETEYIVSFIKTVVWECNML